MQRVDLSEYWRVGSWDLMLAEQKVAVKDDSMVVYLVDKKADWRVECLACEMVDLLVGELVGELVDLTADELVDLSALTMVEMSAASMVDWRVGKMGKTRAEKKAAVSVELLVETLASQRVGK